MHVPNGLIVVAIHRTEFTVSGKAALEFRRHILHHRFLERIGAASEKKGAEKSDE